MFGSLEIGLLRGLDLTVGGDEEMPMTHKILPVKESRPLKKLLTIIILDDYDDT
jgi:hypothetical protein